ncbi:MAG: ATP-binding cassette domain-containing protein, partial [Bacilli bacterium]|nr:ATP-binding cassette domain-containing protein [Bacilli bacterium]
MIELIDVKKTYKSKKGLSYEALKGINLKLGNKGMTFVLGKSGSGKSTLLNILGGLDKCTSGDIQINGVST